MAKLEVDVLLKDGTDESTFINDVTSNTEVDLKNRLPNSPTLVVLDVEESYINTLENNFSGTIPDEPSICVSKSSFLNFKLLSFLKLIGISLTKMVFIIILGTIYIILN